mgnify:CR=1 FL=1
MIVATTTDKNVVSFTTREDIIARATIQPVVARPAIQRVLATAATQDVVALAAARMRWAGWPLVPMAFSPNSSVRKLFWVATDPPPGLLPPKFYIYR